MSSNKKGQVSVELMIVIGFILIFFIPLLLISYFKVIELNEDLSKIQAEVAVERLANTMDSIGRMGVGSSILLDVYLPLSSNLEFVSYPSGGGEIILSLEQSSGLSESVGTTWFSIDADPSTLPGGGNYKFNITSVDGGVSVVQSK